MLLYMMDIGCWLKPLSLLMYTPRTLLGVMPFAAIIPVTMKLVLFTPVTLIRFNFAVDCRKTSTKDVIE